MFEEGIQQQVQVTVSVDHPLKDETQQFFFTGVRIAIAADNAAGKAWLAPDRNCAARPVDIQRELLPTELADAGSRSRGTRMPTLRTNRSRETGPV